MSAAKFETGEGSVSADRDPSSGTDFVRATFSHKGRREEESPQFVPNMNLPSLSRYGPVRM